MGKSVSKFLGFTDAEIREIARAEKIKVPRKVNLVSELRAEHTLAIAA